MTAMPRAQTVELAPVSTSDTTSQTPATRPRVVVIGAGFGGLAAATALRKAPVTVTVIDRRNYHLFQPLLYQVATAALSPADIASPIRAILRYQTNAEVVLAKVIGIDKDRREVVLQDHRSVPYDFLVVATGARHAYFGHDEWEPFAPGLKKIDDATELRRRILLSFEQAEIATDAAERRRLLTFVVIGGGPTGVEMAGAIAELAKMALARDFRHIDPRQSRVLLIEAGPRILSSFPAKLSEKALRALKRLGVEVRTGAAVTACDAEGVQLGEERIPSGCLVWAAGVAASPAAKWLEAERDKVGRVMVNPDLTLPGHPQVFVIGDTAHLPGPDGKPLPGVAPVAKQQGKYVAKLIGARLAGASEPGPFRYRNLGNLATIGRRAAVADFGWIRVSGRVAWLLWGLVHIYFLIGFRNRIAVILDWIWAYLTFQRGARLITGPNT
jgi:NADH:ubiquinone reductase (H+-translocating)